MRVFITGGAGFVGSHLAEALLARGDEVSVLDNLSTGSIDNITHLKTHERFSYTIDAIENEPLVAELIDGFGFDVVDAGSLAQSWRIQPGTPGYVQRLNAEELTAALAAARRTSQRP